MKKIMLFTLIIMLICSLCACSQVEISTGDKNDSGKTIETSAPVYDATQDETEETTETVAETTVPVTDASTEQSQVTTEPVKVESKIGTRANPYNFTDEIKIKNRVYDIFNPSYYDLVEYTIHLTEVWDSDRVAKKYPSYIGSEGFGVDKIIVRGEISAECDSTEEKVDFNIYADFLTATLSEEYAKISAYEKDKFGYSLGWVYPGGTYDINFESDEGTGDMAFAYLKLQYTDENDNFTSLWIKLPESVDDSDNSQTESSNEPQKELTSEELDAALLEQPMYVESTKYVVQDDRFKALYPDMLQAIVKNNSGTDVKNIVIAFVAWDKNNFPVKIYNSGVDIDGAYVKRCKFENANVVDGATCGSGKGYAIDEKSGIATFKAIVVSYDDFDGNTWENPYFAMWVDMYSDKVLK